MGILVSLPEPDDITDQVIVEIYQPITRYLSSQASYLALLFQLKHSGQNIPGEAVMEWRFLLGCRHDDRVEFSWTKKSDAGLESRQMLGVYQ